MNFLTAPELKLVVKTFKIIFKMDKQLKLAETECTYVGHLTQLNIIGGLAPFFH